jgi:hypothetical protein
MCDWEFSAVTMQRTQNNDMLTIVVCDNSHIYSTVEPLLKRYMLSKAYHRHPLLPILLIADAALEDYRDGLDDLISQSESTIRVVDAILQQELSLYQRELTVQLAAITGRRERLSHVAAFLRAFHSSLRNLLNLHDGSDALKVTPGSLQSPSTPAGDQVIPIPPLDSMLQYLISASGDMLERSTAGDTILQTSFIVVRIRDGHGTTTALLTLANFRRRFDLRSETLKSAFD